MSSSEPNDSDDDVQLCTLSDIVYKIRSDKLFNKTKRKEIDKCENLSDSEDDIPLSDIRKNILSSEKLHQVPSHNIDHATSSKNPDTQSSCVGKKS